MTPTGLIIFYSILGAMALIAVGMLIWILWYVHKN